MRTCLLRPSPTVAEIAYQTPIDGPAYLAEALGR